MCTCYTLWVTVRHSLVVPDSSCLNVSLKAETGARVDADLTFQDACPAEVLEAARHKGSKTPMSVPLSIHSEDPQILWVGSHDQVVGCRSKAGGRSTGTDRRSGPSQKVVGPRGLYGLLRGSAGSAFLRWGGRLFSTSVVAPRWSDPQAATKGRISWMRSRGTARGCRLRERMKQAISRRWSRRRSRRPSRRRSTAGPGPAGTGARIWPMR